MCGSTFCTLFIFSHAEVRGDKVPRCQMKTIFLNIRRIAVCARMGALALCSATVAYGQSSPDFSKDIAPILTKYCTGCHNDADREGKLSLESYASLLKGGAKGSVITPGQA